MPSQTAPYFLTTEAMATPCPQTSFASLPRELRDKIYRLALPHSCEIKLTLRSHPLGPSESFRILSPQASNGMIAEEACETLFRRNTLKIRIADLPMLLGENGISSVYEFYEKHFYVIPGGQTNVKSWLRQVNLILDMNNDMDKLAERLGFLHDCHFLKEVIVTLHGNHSLLKANMGYIQDGFKVLKGKLGRHLAFVKYVNSQAFSEEYGERVRYVGDLDDLEKIVQGDDLLRGFDDDVEEDIDQ
ncbi:MAG: hypothetical protein Q9213_008416 [Squamulea squamosa]